MKCEFDGPASEQNGPIDQIAFGYAVHEHAPRAFRIGIYLGSARAGNSSSPRREIVL